MKPRTSKRYVERKWRKQNEIVYYTQIIQKTPALHPEPPSYAATVYPATATASELLHRYLPVNLLREVLRDQPLVVRPQLDRVDGVIVLRVEVVRVESFHGCEGLEVFLVREVGVGAFAVPSVEWRDGDDEHKCSGAVEEGKVMEERRRTGRSCGSGSWRDLPRGGSFGL